MRKYFTIFCIAYLLGAHTLTFAQPSVLSTGSWYKFSTSFEGVFKITHAQLRAAGINPAQLDPRNIQLYTGDTGMLPQANDKARTRDLNEMAILVVGEEDGVFNTDDYILFFGQGPDRYSFDTRRNIFEYENHLFTDKNFYFLTIASRRGKRIAQRENIPGTFPVISQFDDFAFYESEKYNLIKSGRQWFGEQFDVTTEATVRFSIAGIIESTPLRFVSHTMAQSLGDCSFKVQFNNVPFLEQPIPKIDNTSYGIKGNVKRDTLTLSTTQVNAHTQTNQEIKYQFTKGAGGLSVGYLDFFLFSFKRKLARYGDQTFFVSSASLANANSSFEISSTPAGTTVWDVSDPFTPVRQGANLANDKTSFNAPSSELRKYGVFSPDKAFTPVFENKVENQNLHGLVAPAFVIITHPSLKTQAQRLANHRRSFSKISVAIVTTEEIYHEYAGGKQDITAIRDFLRDLYVQPSSAIKNVLLFGRGSYDYKNRVLNNTNLVPVYESRNSLSPLETYSSDDFYTFFEPNEGEWRESPAQDHTMDVGIGRIPAKNLEEAKVVVDKLIEYDLDPDSFGPWRQDFLFVADDGDFNIHQGQADELANSIETRFPQFSTKKFYLDSFEQLQRASGEYSPAAYDALDVAIRKGALIVNYTGHGSEQIWMQERVLDADMITNWKTGAPYPLFVTATCEFGRNDDPFQISSGEKTLLQRRGGAIGLVTTARPVFSSTNFTLNVAFYEALFKIENGSYQDLGTIFRNTKNRSRAGVGNRNFSLLGDPSMMLAMPRNEIEITELKTDQGSTILQGLSSVVVKGQLKSNNVINTSFDGEVEMTLQDREITSKTKGNENPAFEYKERPNLLYRGRASVKKGVFAISFVLPKNFLATGQNGKATFYARSTQGDAIGSYSAFTLNGINSGAIADSESPSIKIFLGDTTFQEGGIVTSDTRLIAQLQDKSGINISQVNNNGISATLDETLSINLNDYYVSNVDDATTGKAIYPLLKLKKGEHTISVSASDTHGNRNQASIRFVVSESNQIQIQSFTNYPNPFYESTRLQFQHSRQGEDLEATLIIYDIAGNLALKKTYEIPSSQNEVELAEWAGDSSDGIKLKQGLYLARLSVRSLSDGSKNERFTKLILLN